MPLNVGSAREYYVGQTKNWFRMHWSVIVMLGIPIVWRIKIKQHYFHIFSLSQEFFKSK